MAAPKLQKWWQVYNGQDEQYFFTGLDGASGLIRHPDYAYRSVASLAKESGLTQAQVEKIINKYANMGLIVQHPTNADKWAYWDRAESKDGAKATLAAGDPVKEDQRARAGAKP